MNYKIYFEHNKASYCEAVKKSNDMADYTTVNNKKIIRSMVISALSEKEACIIGERLAEKLAPL